MSDIILWDIIFEVDGKFYTTKRGVDHSVICDCVDMDDLELIDLKNYLNRLIKEE